MSVHVCRLPRDGLQMLMKARALSRRLLIAPGTGSRLLRDGRTELVGRLQADDPET